MKIILVYNPKSGSAKSLTELRKLFKQHGIIVRKAISVQTNLHTILSSSIKSGGHVAVVGGDGTLSTVAGVLVRSKAVLIPLPGGSLNHFTKDLGVSQNLDEAIANIKHAHERRIDIASVNERYFINNSSIGLYPSSLQVREQFESKLGKWPAAIAASVRVFFRLHRYRLMINGKYIKTPFLFVGNNHYDIHTTGIARRQSIAEGVLTIFTAKNVSRWRLLILVFLAFVGKAAVLNEFEEHIVKELFVKGPSFLLVSHDGEITKLRTPLTYRVHSKALRVRY